MTRSVVQDPRLAFSPESATAAITDFLREQRLAAPRSEGFVVGLSGGVDSAVTLALAVRAAGVDDCSALMLPERHSSPASLELATKVAEQLGVAWRTVEMTQALEVLGVYPEIEATVRELFPEYGSDWRCRLVLPGDLREHRSMNVYSLEVRRPDGVHQRRRVARAQLRQLQAANNVKQRLRMTLLYREAEATARLVAGTTNFCEYDQGFFVLYGDGGVDVEPIAHLYKQQVRALAHHLGLPAEVADRPASPDTWSEPVADEEFFFRLPYDLVDAFLARERAGLDDTSIAAELELETEQVAHIRSELQRRRESSRGLRRLPPSLLDAPGDRS